MKSARFQQVRFAHMLMAPALVALLAFGGCKKEEPPPPVVVVKHAPKDLMDKAAWQDYYGDVVSHNSQGVDGTSSAYFLPAPGTPKYDDMFQAQQTAVTNAVAAGFQSGNLVAFMSPDSTKMADLVVAAFAKASPGSMKKVVILFVGKPEDSARVKAAVDPSGATFRFAPFN